MKTYLFLFILLIIPLTFAEDCDRIDFGVQDNLDINNRFIIYLNWDNEICMINSSCFGSLNNVRLITPEDIDAIEDKEQNLTRSYPKLSWQLLTKKRDNYEIQAELRQDDEIICTKTVEANFLPDIKNDIIVAEPSKQNIAKNPTKESPKEEKNAEKETTQPEQSSSQEQETVIIQETTSPVKPQQAKPQNNNTLIILISAAALLAAVLIFYILRPKR